MEGRRAITPRAAAAWILEAPAAAWALALVALAFGLWSGLGDRYLHDEGLLTWHFAQVTLEAPAAALFWQKSRPLLAALYGPFAGLGKPVFTVIHVVIAALALPLLAGVARAIGQRSPNLPALLVASSALWLACGPAGVSNSDALTGLCLALYLWLARGRPLAAGLLLGALLFARSEVAVFAGGIGLYALLRGRGAWPWRSRRSRRSTRSWARSTTTTSSGSSASRRPSRRRPPRPRASAPPATRLASGTPSTRWSP